MTARPRAAAGDPRDLRFDTEAGRPRCDAGAPFVGAAGRGLDHALAELGIDRTEAYVTNVVKHFKFETRGKRRIHKKPGRLEIGACRPWLDEELDLIRPEAIALLGATAAHALVGPSVRLRSDRGRLLDPDLAPFVLVTIHPAAIPRASDVRSRHEERRACTADIATLWRALGHSAA